MYDVAKFQPSVKQNQENRIVDIESQESLQIFREERCLTDVGQLLIERFSDVSA